MTHESPRKQHRRNGRRRISRMVSNGEQYLSHHPLFVYSAFVGVSLLLLGSVAIASLPA